jgi:hypothetical protein
MSKCKTVKGTKLLMKYKTLLQNKIQEIMRPLDAELAEIKGRHHAGVIETNAIRKELIEIEESISLELKIEMEEQQRVAEQYKYKTDLQVQKANMEEAVKNGWIDNNS